MPCSPGMVRCYRGCLHRRLVQEYRVAREAAVQQRELETRGWPAELAAYPPIITFHVWLCQLRDDTREDEPWD